MIPNVDIGECPYCERLIDKRYATQKDGETGFYHRQCLQDEMGIVQANRIDAMMASLEND